MATHTAALVRMNRWVILAGYALLTACTQLLWLAYAQGSSHREIAQALGLKTASIKLLLFRAGRKGGCMRSLPI